MRMSNGSHSPVSINLDVTQVFAMPVAVGDVIDLKEAEVIS